jgi:uncharacterized protein YkwD
MKQIYLIVIIVAVLGLVIAAPGCSKKHSSSRSGSPSYDTGTGDTGGGGGTGGGTSGTGTGSGSGTGSGTGGTPTGDTVPGDISLGLSENPEAPRMTGGTADEQMIANMVNDFRAENGLSPFAWNDGIADCERSHAYDMEQQNYFSHGSKSNSSYSICTARSQSLGLGGVLESNCMDSALTSVVQAWINSSAHREQLLNSNNTRHGVGISTNNRYICHASN